LSGHYLTLRLSPIQAWIFRAEDIFNLVTAPVSEMICVKLLRIDRSLYHIGKIDEGISQESEAL
jgi:hypothetical protein